MCAQKASRKVLEKDIKPLYGLSAARCNICKTVLFELKADKEGFIHLGEMAHNVAFSDAVAAPRAIDGRSGDNSYNNLILLCALDHKRVDQDPDFYTVERLREIKRKFEFYVDAKFGPNIQKDLYLLESIHKEVNFQTMLNALEWQPSYISLDIMKISTFLDTISKNTPSYYPLKTLVFHNLTLLISENWKSLRSYLLDQNIFIHLEASNECKLKLVSDRDFRTIKLNCIYLKAAFELWIEVIRRDFPEINLR